MPDLLLDPADGSPESGLRVDAELVRHRDQLEQPAPDRVPRLTSLRLTLLTVASLIAPIVEATQERRERAREMEPLRQAAEKAAAGVPGVLSATVVLTAHREPARDPMGPKPGGTGRAGPPPTAT